jgi:predicted CXXCH cytochrome family protein
MNLMGKINKVYFNSLLILFLLASSVYTLPSTNVLAAGEQLTITQPAPSVSLDSTAVVVSGTYSTSNTVSSTDLQLTASDNLGTITDPNSNVVWTDNGNNTWSFTKTFNLYEGTNNLTIGVIENIANPPTPATSSVSFTVSVQRPYITNSGVILSDNTTRNGEDLTYVPTNARITLDVIDNNPMNNLENKTSPDDNPIILMRQPKNANETATRINGSVSIQKDTTQLGKFIYHLIFTPDSSTPLVTNTNYTVSVDPNLVDDSNLNVYPKTFKFTTSNGENWDDMDDQNHESFNPHGHYQLNTNMCASCHSTHINSPYDEGINPALNPAREGGSYLIDFNQDLSKNAADNYCLACHDGTVNNAPIIDNINSNTYHHDYDAQGNSNSKEASSCTSCHNPHLEWSEKNPNLLQNHYVYEHSSTDKIAGTETPVGVVDSLDTHCEKCHGDYTIHNSDNTLSSIFDQKYISDPQNYGDKVLNYNKSLTSSGNITDYALCFKCHKANNTNGATNIKDFYLDANSGHNFTTSNGKAVQDGSPLNGQIPCAECHETHGSNNIKLLKGKLGEDNPQDFSAPSGSWDPDTENRFCRSCHNGLTAIYGVTAKIPDSNTSPTGHVTGSGVPACSSCHGGSSNSIIEAAHAPQRGS